MGVLFMAVHWHIPHVDNADIEVGSDSRQVPITLNIQANVPPLGILMQTMMLHARKPVRVVHL